VKYIFYILLYFNIVLCDNFVKGENIVLDITNNMVWQDNIEVVQNASTFSEAKEYCRSLFLNGFSDWKLPTIKELQTIVDITRVKPAINDQFKFIEPTSYWSSSEDIIDDGYGWYIGFKTGATYKDNKDYACFVRCVRKKFKK